MKREILLIIFIWLMTVIECHSLVFAEENKQYIRWGTQDTKSGKMVTVNVYSVSHEAISETEADLILKGKILAMEIIDAPDREHNFVVVIEIKETIKGEYPYFSFQFLIHSPRLSGLKVGEEIIIKAVRDENGFIVKNPDYH